MTLQLDIRGCGTVFFILHQGATVGGPYSSHDNAVAALRGVERRLDPKVAKFRCCCTCRRGFMSTGEVKCPSCSRRAGRG